MFTIGLIDDEESQLTCIRRTIKKNKPSDEEINFLNYSLSEDSEELVEEVFQEVMNDIIKLKINCLIVDYKIMVRSTKIHGTDIFGKIKEIVHKFPIIILTEVVEESIEPNFIDADKVYKKSLFFKLENEYAQEKTANIFDSMKKYKEKREELESELAILKKSFSSSPISQEKIKRVLEIENFLEDYMPIDQSECNKMIFDIPKLKEIVELIEEANRLLV